MVIVVIVRFLAVRQTISLPEKPNSNADPAEQGARQFPASVLPGSYPVRWQPAKAERQSSGRGKLGVCTVLNGRSDQLNNLADSPFVFRAKNGQLISGAEPSFVFQCFFGSRS